MSAYLLPYLFATRVNLGVAALEKRASVGHLDQNVYAAPGERLGMEKRMKQGQTIFPTEPDIEALRVEQEQGVNNALTTAPNVEWWRLWLPKQSSEDVYHNAHFPPSARLLVITSNGMTSIIPRY